MAIFKDFSAVVSSQRLLREIVHSDGLTGVANRSGLRERWEVETHNNPGVALAFLMMDLDDFKPVNDRHGHAVGDEVLKIVAKRLVEAVRSNDLVCRLGGDEFGILLVAPGGAGQIKVVCDRILSSIADPIIVGDLVLGVSASMGASIQNRPRISSALIGCCIRARRRARKERATTGSPKVVRRNLWRRRSGVDAAQAQTCP
ncbi:diguanylate cyclase/phosphodiesterase (GGDEF & EAL domains) with PAS/PAC sensor(s) [plant metagenome]|uniref:Diguanylate cyclase/phosphodiesterase (GGDEF & EAL domains) with PAS/PAC sensor(S) n=1 Tax=plant metagenome TaxID=1297885 RepID=A0A484S7I1_9ZZZZ